MALKQNSPKNLQKYREITGSASHYFAKLKFGLLVDVLIFKDFVNDSGLPNAF